VRPRRVVGAPLARHPMFRMFARGASGTCVSRCLRLGFGPAARPVRRSPGPL
jgi:hypothetical protein